MIVECPGCQSRYDVSGRPPGTRARCRCGQVFPLPEPEERAGELSCPQCAANVSPRAKACDYCSAELLVKACPRCFARVFHGAKHCNHCGAEVGVPAKVTGEGQAAQRRCPACREDTGLEGRLAGDVLLDECPGCHGVFLDTEALGRIIREREGPSVEQVAGVRSGNAASSQRPPALPPGRAMYIRCPDCDTMMNRKNFGRSSGIIVDYCRAHGTWFDPGELPHVIEFVTSGGLDEARAKAMARESEEARRSGAVPVSSPGPAQRPHAGVLDHQTASRNVNLFEGLLSSIGNILRSS